MLATLDVPYQDTAAAALGVSLALERRPALAERYFPARWGGARLGVLGASHQVSVFARPVRLTFAETVACGQAVSRPLEPASVRARAYEWTMDCAVDALEADAAEALRQRAAAEDRAIAAAFPGHPDALTALFLHLFDDGATWTTFHAYPESAELVTTRSTFRWRDPCLATS